MSVFTLKSSQFLPISIGEAWDFFSSPDNLRVITPDHMGFEIVNRSSETMYPGMIIQYTVKPILGLKMTWVTEISQVKPPHYFVDTQLVGPYSLWHHQHRFRQVDGGIVMEDEVNYKLPLGILGAVMQPILVKGRVNGIFEYRKNKLGELFANESSQKQVISNVG